MSQNKTSSARAAVALCTAAIVSVAATGCMTMGGMAMSPQMKENHMAMHAFSMAVHMGEIEEAQLAQSKSQNPAVREFAQRMITEHTAAMRRGEQMMMKMGMSMGGGAGMAAGEMDMQRKKAMLMDHPHSRPVMQAHMQNMQTLQGLTGQQFDATYLGRQVAMHRYTLEQMDRMMSSMGMMAGGAMAGSTQGAAGMDHGAMGSGNMNMDLPATPAGVMMLHRAERAMVAEHLQMAQQRMQSMRSM